MKRLRHFLRLDSLPPTLTLWGPALVGISLMLAIGAWGGGVARYLLFTHHLFWFVGLILLINPVIETLSPSRSSRKPGEPRARPRPHRPRRPVRKGPEAGRKDLGSASDLQQRLTHLMRRRDLVDRKLHSSEKEPVDNPADHSK